MLNMKARGRERNDMTQNDSQDMVAAIFMTPYVDMAAKMLRSPSDITVVASGRKISYQCYSSQKCIHHTLLTSVRVSTTTTNQYKNTIARAMRDPSIVSE